MAIHHFSPHHSPSSSSISSSSSSSFEQDEDYIDLELVSSSHNSIFHSSTTSPNREFEFHMTSSLSLDMDPTTTSPADQLFYNGKLLPLQMLHNLLHQQQEEEQELYSTPFATPPSTPIMSCHVSRELVSDDYFAEEEAIEFGGDRSSTKLWTSKIKEMIRQSLFKTKIKIRPKSYVWSLFGKSGCSHQSSCATTSLYQGSTIKVKDRVPKRHPKVGSTSSSSSSSSTSTHSTRLSENQLLQRLHESPIQGAIKHCKQSQYLGTTV